MGVVRRFVAGESALPDVEVCLEQFFQKTNLEDMPTVPLAWLENALTRLTPEERDFMLRHKIVPYVWLPDHVIHGVVTEAGLATAEAAGLNVVGRIRVEDYRSLVRRFFGRTLLNFAVSKLERRLPWASAKRRLTWGQMGIASGICCVFAVLGFFNGISSVTFAVNLAATLFFCMVVGLRCVCLMSLPKGRGVVAPLLSESDLPVYTVLVPLFREVSVLPQLINALSLLDYPKYKLDIKIILEDDDIAMHRAVQALSLPDYFDVIVVPAGKPQTKPRALNYAMLFARGTLVTIYDSEDIPQPNQLKLAAAQLAASDENVACLQAALEFYNPNENWLTRQFTAEYAALFQVMLPTLAAHHLPLLLGGTSNHFRASALETVGGWDAYNVTEDADLGIRLARYGFQTRVLHSSTYEEANPEIWNWLKQRRRWLKGFLQCWLVHNRNPVLLLRELGLPGFCVVQCMTLGIFLSSLLHPVFLLITAWNFLPAQMAVTVQMPFGNLMTAISLLVLLSGYAAGIIMSSRGLQRIGIRNWGEVLLGIPIYWLLMSVAAWLALWDFCVAPYHWHKTRHGLSRNFAVAGQKLTSYPKPQ
jgi:glycosyltransferase XagB